jgi:hypothetical protein
MRTLASGINRCRARLLAGAAVALVLLAAPTAAYAAGPAVLPISIAPVGTANSYFIVTMRPGESRQLTVQFTGNGSSAGTAFTYAADVYTVVDGGLGVRLRNQPTTGVTKWVAYQAETVTLARGSTERRTFTVSVPKGASPGEHITSLVVESRIPAATGGQITLNQVVREALPIVIDVPGPTVAGVAIGTASEATVSGRSVVSIGVTNAGNVRIHLSGQLIVTANGHQKVAAVALTMGTVFPGDSTVVEAVLPLVLRPGQYTVSVRLADPALGVSASRTDLRLALQGVPSRALVTSSPAVTGIAGGRPGQGLSAMSVGALIAGGVLVGAATASLAGGRRRRRVASRCS